MNPSMGGSGATSLLLTVLIATTTTSTCRRCANPSETNTLWDSCNAEGVMFRMNGISRLSTWMCGAIVSILHATNYNYDGLGHNIPNSVSI